MVRSSLPIRLPKAATWAPPPFDEADAHGHQRHIAATIIQHGAATCLTRMRTMKYGMGDVRIVGVAQAAVRCRFVLNAARRRRAAANTVTRCVLQWLYRPGGPMMRAGLRFMCQLGDAGSASTASAVTRENQAQQRHRFDMEYRPIKFLNRGYYRQLCRDNHLSPELHRLVESFRQGY